MVHLLDFIRMVYQGKTLRRIVFNLKLKERCKNFRGKILDLGAGAGQTYTRYLCEGAEVTSTDIVARQGVVRVDLNRPLPFPDESFDVVTLFHVIYILEDSVSTLREIRRVLKTGGKLYVASSLVSAEIPEPHDYNRLTKEGLAREFTKAGFSKFTIERVGGRASSAAIVLHPFFVFNTVRLLVFPLCLLLDRLTRARDVHHPMPHSYFSIVEK